ncbi:MAG: succinate dehydrogenase/fumarate reductase iron-sulfur subunit [Alistipes sp.]|nr:succinate dehydrogenase/fumarate reductase iron-sulfur subunit [Candidatus Minthomonas equi]
MDFKLKVWRQKNAKDKGHFETYSVTGISPDTSFLEMMDILNDQLIREGNDPVALNKGCKSSGPIAFDHDCREGICGMCSLYINGRAHGPGHEATTCQLYMRLFKDGETITVEPWRSAGFPVIKDLVVNRGAFDQILQAGGFISVNAGSAPDANSIPIPKKNSDLSMDASACVGCGACVATCKNGSAMLFVSARVSSLALLPQGKVEAARRAKAMVAKMDELGFGACTNTQACQMECPKAVSVSNIARLNREYLCAKFQD